VDAQRVELGTGPGRRSLINAFVQDACVNSINLSGRASNEFSVAAAIDVLAELLPEQHRKALGNSLRRTFIPKANSFLTSRITLHGQLAQESAEQAHPNHSSGVSGSDGEQTEDDLMSPDGGHCPTPIRSVTAETISQKSGPRGIFNVKNDTLECRSIVVEDEHVAPDCTLLDDDDTDAILDAQRFSPCFHKGWADDHAVNSYFKLIQLRLKEKQWPRVHVMSSYFFTKLSRSS